MKRFLKFLVLMIIAVISLALTGCDSNEDNGLYGKYYATYVKCNDNDISSTYSMLNMTLNRSGNVVINEIRDNVKNNYRGKLEYEELFEVLELTFGE